MLLEEPVRLASVLAPAKPVSTSSPPFLPPPSVDLEPCVSVVLVGGFGLLRLDAVHRLCVCVFGRLDPIWRAERRGRKGVTEIPATHFVRMPVIRVSSGRDHVGLAIWDSHCS